MMFITPEKYGANFTKCTDRDCRFVLSNALVYVEGKNGGLVGDIGKNFDLAAENNKAKFNFALIAFDRNVGHLQKYLANASTQTLEDIARIISKKTEEGLGKDYLAGWETYSPEKLRRAIPEALIAYTNDVRERVIEENNEKFPLRTDKQCMAVLGNALSHIGGSGGGLIGNFGRKNDLSEEANRNKYNAHILNFKQCIIDLRKYLEGASPQAIEEIAETVRRECAPSKNNPLTDWEAPYSQEIKDIIPDALLSYENEIEKRIEELQGRTNFKAYCAPGEKDEEGNDYLTKLQKIIGSGDIGVTVGIILEKSMLVKKNQEIVEKYIEQVGTYIEDLAKCLPMMCDKEVVEIAEKINSSKNYKSSNRPLKDLAEQTPEMLRGNIIRELQAQVSAVENKYREVKEMQLRLKLGSNELLENLPSDEKALAINVLVNSDPKIYEKNSEIKAEHDKFYELVTHALRNSSGLDGEEKGGFAREITELFELLDKQKRTTSLAEQLSKNGVDVKETYDFVFAHISDEILEYEEEISKMVSSFADREKVIERNKAEEGMIIIPESVLGLFLRENLETPSDGFFKTVSALAEQGVYVTGTPQKPVVIPRSEGIHVQYTEKEDGIKVPNELKEGLLSALSNDGRLTAEIIMSPAQTISKVWDEVRTELVNPAIEYADVVCGLKKLEEPQPQVSNTEPDIIELVYPGQVEPAAGRQFPWSAIGETFAGPNRHW